jgi:hydroxymethylpyrimidine/phosphomethylpyrimidine kinase
VKTSGTGVNGNGTEICAAAAVSTTASATAAVLMAGLSADCEMRAPGRALASSDSGGGAGIQADLKTFAAFGVYGLSAITAVTAQNTQGVCQMSPMSPELMAAQVEAVAADFPIEAVKIGMLATSAHVATAAELITRLRLKNVVLDPVMMATSGHRLLDAPGVDALRARLLPLATVLTPNLAEAEALTGLRVQSLLDMERAAARLAELGARAIVMTGGHLDGPPIDVVWEAGTSTRLTGERLSSRHTHGTGCTFSAAIAARLALGDALLPAIREAKAYVAAAIARAPGLGRGRGPLGHL